MAADSPALLRSTGGNTRTHQGGTGHSRDAKSELFLLAVANFVSQQTFYESGDDRDHRFAALVGELAVDDFDEAGGGQGALPGS